jgi:long-chain acyl-CoA synthetase
MPEAPPPRPHLATFVEDFRRHGDQIAVASREGLRWRTVTCQHLADLSARFAAELAARGVEKGDRVLIWGENGGAWLAAFFGCLLRGALAVPIDVAGSASFARRVASEVSPKMAACGRDQLGLLESAAPRIAFEEFETALSRAPEWRPVEGLSENDPMQIVFTSGTTGEPKGVVHTHRNILASLRPIEREMQKYLKYERFFHPLRFLHTLPLSHVFGQFMGIWIPALLAAEVHFESRLVPGELIETIRRERISVLAAVPRVLELLETYLLTRFTDLEGRLRSAQRQSAWRRWWIFRDVHRAFGFKFWALVCGGATLAEEIEQFWNTLGFVVVQGYGMTETAALVSLNHPFHPARGSIGKVLPGREVRLGPDGEIQVRGETVSGATWEGGRLQSRGSEWLDTGDLASLDEEGNLKFRGRKKEVIVTAAGLNIYPDDLEAALLRQPQVKAAAVVEAAGPKGSEPLAALILHGPADPTASVRAANAELAEFQQIRRWTVWPDLDFPRTSTGKIKHREVAAALRGLSREGGGAPPSGGMLASLIARITGENVAALPDSALLSEDVHLDSLGRVELQSLLETQFGVAIDDARYQQVRTLGELKALLEERAPEASVEAAEAGAEPQAAPRDEHVYPVWPWSRVQHAIRVVFMELAMQPLVAILANPRVLTELTEPPPRPVLIVANHVTAYDVPLILYALPARMRHRVAVAMSGEMLLDMRKGRRQGNFFVDLVAPAGYLLITGLFNVFPLPQLGNFRRSFAHAGRAMDAGFHVMVFPEGRRSPGAQIQAFQTGSGMLWKELRADALPVYLEGIGELKATGERWFRSGRIAIRVGKPIPFDPDLEAADATRVLEQAVHQLSPSGPWAEAHGGALKRAPRN